jgi:4,5-dihydroxyphthalate decarboxylase
MTKPVLRAVTRRQGNNAALVDGEIVPEGFAMTFESGVESIPGLVGAFRRMVRSLEFDIAEMALTTYLCAREHGVEFTALPVFLVRAFHHGAILHNTNRPVHDPRELEGRRVGVGRGYTVTTGVWARAVLADEHGVDLDRVTWVLSGDEHVEAYRPPPNVEPIAPGGDIERQLLDGELAAAINVRTDNPAIRPLIADAEEAGLAAYRARRHYPINHCIVVRNDVLAAQPQLASALFEAFSASKQRYVDWLRRQPLDVLSGSDRLYKRIQDLGDEPLPYGIEPNRHVLDELISHAMAQGILTRKPTVDSLFATSTRTLVG